MITNLDDFKKESFKGIKLWIPHKSELILNNIYNDW